MDSFILNAKRRLTALNQSQVLVVLGNEACDLDSAVSTIVYSYYLATVLSYPGRLVIPVLNIPRNALHLRTEVVYTFKKENISLDSLVCKDEIDLKTLYDKAQLELVLVDQNVLRDFDKYFESAVVEIIDHHKEEYQPREKLRKVTIEPVGSCCTLIVERILQTQPGLLSSQVARLLYSTILIDTTNLSEVTQRATSKDKDAVMKLEEILVGINRQATFKEIQTAKDCVEGFTLVDLLQKDQKLISIGQTVVAFSTLVTTLQDFAHKIQDTSDLEKYCTVNGINILVLLNSIITDNSVLRELAVYSTSEDAADKVCKILLESKSPDLALTEKTLERHPVGLNAFNQGNATFTRKAVLPLIKETMSNQVQEFDELSRKQKCK